MKKRLYKWHRVISLIVGIPVILWAASGFMHPIMTTFRPAVKIQQTTPVPVDTSRIELTPADIFKINNLSSIHDLRVIHIDTNWFYQIRRNVASVPEYFSTQTGRKLNNGDIVYAHFLARQFLEGEKGKKNDSPAPNGSAAEQDDCCASATKTALDEKGGAPIISVKRINQFDGEYGDVNKILPVYKVSFDRKDGIRVYVETVQDRFVYAVDNKRAFFDWVFGIFHTWDWADALGNAKLFVMAILLSMAFLTALAGICLFFSTKSIKPGKNPKLKWRFNHRWVSIVGSLFTLLFTFSGAFHALEKTKPDERYRHFNDQTIETARIISLPPFDQKQICNFSLVKMGDSIYWRTIAFNKTSNNQTADKPIWSKDKKMEKPEIHYASAKNGQPVTIDEKSYATYLANKFRNTPGDAASDVVLIFSFAGEYGFVNKRLPVWKVQFADNGNERYYIETSTGKLSVSINDNDLWEGYSFSFLHKHHFMDFAGKSARDFSTMFWAAMQIVLVVVGFVFYIRKNKNN